jgi:hypothetical protein
MKLLVICAVLLGVATALPSAESPDGNLADVEKRQASTGCQNCFINCFDVRILSPLPKQT